MTFIFLTDFSAVWRHNAKCLGSFPEMLRANVSSVQQCVLFQDKRSSQSVCVFRCRVITKFFLINLEPMNLCSSFLIPPPPPPILQRKLEDLTHRPRFSSNLVGSKVASWVWAGSRWPHAQGNPAKALQVLTPPLPWVPGWGGSGLGNLPELSGMTSRLPLHHPLLCSHMAPVHRRQPWDEIASRGN